MTETTNSMIFNVIIKKEDNLFIAHCLELDIVATGKIQKDVEKDMGELIVAQVDYAFSNDNLEHLYKPAPKEVWEDFYKCKGHKEKKHQLRTRPKKSARKAFVPPMITTSTCSMFDGVHV